MTPEDFDFKDPEMLRKLAEEKLRKKQADKGKPSEEADMIKLLHELQVHQIELEMQNEELQLAQEVAEEALRKHTLLYDLAPIGFIIVNEKGSIKELNFTAAEMLGEKRFALIDNNFRLFVMEESLPVFDAFIKMIYTSCTKETCRIKIGYDKRQLGTIYIEGMVTGDDKRCLLSVVDISKFSE